MEPLTVVKDFDPFTDGGSGFGAGGKLAAMPQFPFETAPEAFPRRVVVAVAGAAHAGDDGKALSFTAISKTWRMNRAYSWGSHF